MISVVSEARFAAPFKSVLLTKIAAPIGIAAFLCSAAPGIAVSQPPATTPYNSGFYYTPGSTAYPPPSYYNSPSYNAPVAPVYSGYQPYYNSPFYNAPVAPAPPVIGYSP